MKKLWNKFGWILMTIVGSAIFGAGYAVFLGPNDLNAGGITGLSQVIVELVGFGNVGTLSMLINLPLFIIGGVKVGKRFFFGSLIGLSLSSVLIDGLALLPMPQMEPLLAALYGGIVCGIGLGIVFLAGASTGGVDIVVRLVKLKARNVPVGQIAMSFDIFVVTLTGIVFGNISNALYTGITAFICGKMMDVAVYSFDYSKVVMIITKEYEQVAKVIGTKLGRGATYLYSQGTYTLQDSKMVLTAVKKQQIAELKDLVTDIDPKAFIIVQEAHQVLGDGFATHSKNSL